MSKKIAIGGDHAGYELKAKVISALEKQGYTVQNFGTDTADSVDYPDYIHPLAEAMKDDSFFLGIIICGSGNGVAMTANKHEHIRAALCWQAEIAALARQHNDANVMSIPARFVSEELAFRMIDSFLNTPFEGGRHQRRVDKISC
ncbi:ribose 5-phosphate isomerase B [Saprospiraceae bacterium]|nr:ribose 5-phosphate isomerase B [Saprospiraceae bacterium]